MDQTVSKSQNLETPLISLSALTFKARELPIDTQKHMVAFTRSDCSLCKSAGLRSESRLKITSKTQSIIATLTVMESPLLKLGEIGLSPSTWKKLALQPGDDVVITLAEPLDSFGYVRGKLHGNPFTDASLKIIMTDIVEGRYSDIQLASFITSCINCTLEESIALTKTMSETGQQLKWLQHPIVDKHCVGGLPGNRTTMIVVPILAAFGLTIPKVSSRAITSPSGTADTMEVLAPVELSIAAMKRVVDKEGGCIIWGGSVDLSPVDDVLVQIERALDLDSINQLVASVLSKKIASGSTHVLIDIPIGPTAKVRFRNEADILKDLFLKVGEAVGLQLHVVETDGTQPVGRGIGPVLEARDVLSVLRGEKDASQNLKERSLFLAGQILESWGGIPLGKGVQEAQKILEEGRALKKFEAICKAQGGLREPKLSPINHVITTNEKGIVLNMDNRLMARIAKLAGAPDSPAAGVDLHVSLGTAVEKGQPLFTIYAESPGELTYALHYFYRHQEVILIGEQP